MWFCGNRSVEEEEEDLPPPYCVTGYEKDPERGTVCGFIFQTGISWLVD